MPQTDDMHVQLKLVLDCPPGAAWNAIRFGESHGRRIFEDRGGPLTGPLTIITRWRHRMVIATWPDGRTLFRDRLEFSAGILTPFVWIGFWAFWQWRARGLVRLAPDFATRFGTD
jgi:hypothetical protein